jgi:hypothetical protein
MSEPRADQADQADTGEPAAAGATPRDLPGERPPRRLLDRAPSERLASVGAGAATTAGAAAGSPARAILYGGAAAIAGTLVHLAAATLLLWTGGLLIVAVTIGIVIGLSVAFGSGRSLRPWPRRALALALALGSVALAVGLSWVQSGMYLGPLDFVDQVYGLLVPLQLVLAAVGAVAGSR